MSTRKRADAIEDIFEKHGVGAGIAASLFVITFELAKLYVIFHFVIKYW